MNVLQGTRCRAGLALIIALSAINAWSAPESLWIIQLQQDTSTPQARQQFSELLGRELRVSSQYTHVMRGFSTYLNADEAAKIRRHASVITLVEDAPLTLAVDTSQSATTPLTPKPESEHVRDVAATSGAPVIDLIRADEVWSGLATNDSGHLGEGMVIGVIGTGISGSHPAFAATGDDGFTHTNPFGEGVYLGECFDAPDLSCNSKLVGRYSFTADPSLTTEELNGASNRVAGQAAGNRLTQSVSQLGVPLVSGVAPHANLIVYRACEAFTCQQSNILSAMDQAILDGVDVLAHIVSSPVESPWSSIYASASLALRNNNISLAYITGNGGPTPGTLVQSLAAPWVATFIASTHGRSAELKVLTGFTGGDTPPPDELVGGSLGGTISGSIVYAGNLDPTNPDAALCLAPFPQGLANDTILVCDRGQIGRVQKAINAADSGAVGFVLANVEGGSDSVNSDIFPLPGIHLNIANASLLRTWLSSGENHMATIALSDAPPNPELSDRLFSNSSRGPVLGLDYLAPSAAVPSVDIIAPTGTDGFAVVTGTAAGAGAGAIALIKSARPDWSAAEVLSALMTTGVAPLAEQFSDEATTAFDHGGGRIDVAAAVQSGLLLHETETGFVAADPQTGGTPSRMNLAGLIDLNCLEVCEWTRTVTAAAAGSWSVSTDIASGDIAVDVTPTEFTLSAGEQQALEVTFRLMDGSDGAYEGSVLLTPDSAGLHPTRLTLSVDVLGDADFDGIANTVDNCVDAVNVDQRDSDNDGFGNLCDTDLNNDGITNFNDLSAFAQRFQTVDADADFNGDGKVDFIDLEILRGFFLQPPGPSGVSTD